MRNGLSTNAYAYYAPFVSAFGRPFLPGPLSPSTRVHRSTHRRHAHFLAALTTSGISIPGQGREVTTSCLFLAITVADAFCSDISSWLGRCCVFRQSECHALLKVLMYHFNASPEIILLDKDFPSKSVIFLESAKIVTF